MTLYELDELMQLVGVSKCSILHRTTDGIIVEGYQLTVSADRDSCAI